MSIQTPLASDLIGHAFLAATLAMADDPGAARWSARARNRSAATAAASALARAAAWPVSRSARLVGVSPDEVWDARREPNESFLNAEAEARAAVRQVQGLLAPPEEREVPETADDAPEAGVVRLRPLTPAIIGWCRAYVRRGVAIDDLADLFSVAHDTLLQALGDRP